MPKPTVIEEKKEEIRHHISHGECEGCETVVLQALTDTYNAALERALESLPEKGSYPENRERGSDEFEKAEMLRGQGFDTALSQARQAIENEKIS